MATDINGQTVFVGSIEDLIRMKCAAGRTAPRVDATPETLGPVARDIPRAIGFWAVAAILFAFLFGTSAPTPLYPIYQRAFGFSAITLTAIYAAYAASGLIALLITGRVSDHVGRRPVAVFALIVQLLAMLVFIVAADELMLYIARLLQGLATGAAIGALSAWLIDLQPPGSQRRGALVGSTCLLLGLGTGALGAGLLVENTADPLRLVYWVLAVVYLCGLLAMPWIPDAVRHSQQWRGALKPEIGIPRSARDLFWATVPSLVATWALGGLYLSLGPAVASTLVGGNSPVSAGIVVMSLLGTAAVASLILRDAAPRVLMIRGSMLLIAGVTVTLAGVFVGSVAALYAGSAIAGVGLGPAFSAAVRSLVPLALPQERGALLGAVYIVVYVSFSVPAIVAGAATNAFGLGAATYGYGFVVIGLAAATAYAIARMGPETKP